MWWVLLRADAHTSPPTSLSSNGSSSSGSSSSGSSGSGSSGGGGGAVGQSRGGGASYSGARRPPPSPDHQPDRPARKRAKAVAFKAGPAPPPRILAAAARSGAVAPGELGEL